MNIAFVRGQYINNFELQSYYPILDKHKDIEIVGISSLMPKHNINIPSVKLLSPADLPDFPKKLPVLNRLCMGDAMYLLGLENKLRDYDIAHVRETYFHFSSQAIYAKKRNDIKVLVTCSETIPFNHETIPGRKRLKNKVIQGADHFHCLTQKAKDCLVKEGVDPQKITVIPYGVDLKLFRPLPQTRKSNKIQGLFIGRIEKQKGVDELIEAYKKLKLEFNDFSLSVVGQGGDAQKFVDLGTTPTFQPYSKMSEIMRDADFLILPSRSTKYWEEYLGMVLLEAMACGLPIVTTNCGAIPEVVADAGIVVKQADAGELYMGMKEMIERSEMRTVLRKKGLDRVKKYYDADTVSDNLYKLYQKIYSS